jgi:FkbM family methyltransferase
MNRRWFVLKKLFKEKAILKNLNSNWEQLLKAEKKAQGTKWKRWMNSPLQYPLVMTFSKLAYPLIKKEWRKKVTPFFGVTMTIALPSGTDILLNGIKSHDSEIRLSKFLAKQLKPGEIFIDIGAHHGYYTLLASSLVGESGKVFSVEASHHSFKLLYQNTRNHPGINIYHKAAGEKQEEIIFYEYPGPYAEYNTIIKDAYDNASWRRKVKETTTRVETIVLDNLVKEKEISRAIIKIDVEGGEFSVLKGLNQSLPLSGFSVVIEYLFSSDISNTHHQAVNLLKENGYLPHRITETGDAEVIVDIDEYMKKHNISSDNIVFRRP